MALASMAIAASVSRKFTKPGPATDTSSKKVLGIEHCCMDQTLDEATLSTAFFMQRARTWAGQVLSS
ncbi:hypothetical protein, partial [Rhizobium leguminosarum]|uniref:hypothetical protein n=1 Tax=Rhizobium leguminosarum TaxID=384 RepID=UPI001AEC0BEE